MHKKIERLKEKAPELVPFAQRAKVSLDAAQLTKENARVALCIDISGTMYPLFADGKIQSFAEKVLAIGNYFDQDAAIDIFLFADEAYYAGEMNLHNFKDFMTNAWSKYITVYGTHYGKALRKIRQFYRPDNKGEAVNKVAAEAAEMPVLILFLTDGFTTDEEETVKQLIWASYESIFWQFIAIGKSKDDYGQNFWDWVNKPFAKDFGFLKKLDNMEGNRLIDNANFFNVPEDLEIKDTELYEKIMVEYPFWIKAAQEKKILT